jgi:hypothetical protein
MKRGRKFSTAKNFVLCPQSGADVGVSRRGGFPSCLPKALAAALHSANSNFSGSVALDQVAFGQHSLSPDDDRLPTSFGALPVFFRRLASDTNSRHTATKITQPERKADLTACMRQRTGFFKRRLTFQEAATDLSHCIPAVQEWGNPHMIITLAPWPDGGISPLNRLSPPLSSR